MSRTVLPVLPLVSADGRAEARGSVVVSIPVARAVLAALAGLTPHPWQGVVEPGEGSLAAALEGVPATPEGIMEAAHKAAGVRWSGRPWMRVTARFVAAGEDPAPHEPAPFDRVAVPVIVVSSYKKEWNRTPSVEGASERFIALFGDDLPLTVGRLTASGRYMSGQWDSGRYYYALATVEGPEWALATAWGRYAAAVKEVERAETEARMPDVVALDPNRYRWRPLNGGEREVVIHFRGSDAVVSWRSDAPVWGEADPSGWGRVQSGVVGHRSRFIGRIVAWASPRSVAVAPMAGNSGPVRAL